MEKCQELYEKERDREDIKPLKQKFIVENNKELLRSKENILTKTVQIGNSPFDIRFSINQEFKLNSGIKTFSKINTK